MSQRVKAVVVNPDSLSLIPRGLLAEEENQDSSLSFDYANMNTHK